MYKEIRTFTRTAVIAALLALTVCAATAYAAPKRLTSAKPGNCTACHGSDKVLPAGHPATGAMPLASCRECHAKGDPAGLSGKLPLSHVHQLAGVTCRTCHGKSKKPQPVAMEQCIACHGDTDKLAEKTAGVKPQNPHKSPHYGTSLDCTLCHHQHEKSENFCSQCHTFAFKLP